MRVEEGCVFRERFRLQWGVEFSVRMLENIIFVSSERLKKAKDKKRELECIFEVVNHWIICSVA